MAFEVSYTDTFNMLNNARTFHNKRNTRRQLCLYDIAPGTFQKTFFASKLHPRIAEIVKLVYDASQTGSNIVLGLLYGLQQRTQTVQVTSCNATSSKVFICNIKQTKTMVTPLEHDDFVSLFNTCGALFDTELMHHTFINSHKPVKTKTHSAHSSRTLDILREAYSSGNEVAVGQFAAVLMWFLNTKQMNKIQTTDKLCTGTMVSVNLNVSTRLHKTNPCPPPASREHSDDVTPEVVEHEEVIQQAEDVQVTPLQNTEEDIPDSWEDLDF